MQYEDVCHPATLIALRLSDNFDRLRIAIRQGLASPYALSKDDIHIPPAKIRGRVEPSRNGDGDLGRDRPGVFTAHLDTQNGKIRVDHTGNEGFWLEIDVKELAEVWLNAKYHPDNSIPHELASKHREVWHGMAWHSACKTHAAQHILHACKKNCPCSSAPSIPTQVTGNEDQAESESSPETSSSSS